MSEIVGFGAVPSIKNCMAEKLITLCPTAFVHVQPVGSTRSLSVMAPLAYWLSKRVLMHSQLACTRMILLQHSYTSQERGTYGLVLHLQQLAAAQCWCWGLGGQVCVEAEDGAVYVTHWWLRCSAVEDLHEQLHGIRNAGRVPQVVTKTKSSQCTTATADLAESSLALAVLSSLDIPHEKGCKGMHRL